MTDSEHLVRLVVGFVCAVMLALGMFVLNLRSGASYGKWWSYMMMWVGWITAGVLLVRIVSVTW